MSFKTEECEIPSRVVSVNTAEQFGVHAIVLMGKDGKKRELSLAIFNNDYEEYVDPKDVEINRLRKEVARLKELTKKPRKKKRTLLTGEKIEICDLIKQGSTNLELSKEYDVSDSTISRFRIDLRKAGHDV